MSREPQTPAGLARTLAQDTAWWWFISAFVLLHLPLLLPMLGPETLATYSDHYVVLLLLPWVLVALRHRLAEIEHAAERRFWSYLVTAVLCWWLVRLLYVLVPLDHRGTGFHLAIDGIYLLFYVWFLLAMETKPHRHHAEAPLSAVRTREALALGILVFGTLVYFVVIPSNIDPEAYATWTPSLYLYLALDAILAARFAQLAWVSRSARWRYVYGLLGATAVLWGVFGVLEISWWAGAAGWLDTPWGHVLWQLPMVPLVMAARLRHHPFQSELETRGHEISPRSGGLRLLGLVALVLPSMHLGLSMLGMVDEATRFPRELVVFGCVLILGALMLAEQASTLEESRHRTSYLASLIESAPLPIVLLDARGRVLTCNPAFEALFLFSRSQILDQDIDELITDGETRDQARELTRRSLCGEATFSVAGRSRSDKTVVDVRIFGIPLTNAQHLTGIFAIYQDITERLRTEQALKESEERFRRLGEAAFEGIILSEQGRILDANQQAADMFGFTIDEMIGSEMSRRVEPRQKKKVWERSLSGYELPYRVDCFRRDRSRFTIEIRGKSIPYKGRTARVTVIRDVTEQEQ